MGITVTEDFDSRTPMTVGDNSDSQTRMYTVDGVTVNEDSEPNVIAAVSSAAPAIVPGLGVSLIRKTINITERLGPNAWRVQVDFGRSEATQDTITFDTTGGNAHLTQSLATVNRYAPPGLTAPDFGGTIGVTENAIEGVDVTRPKFGFTRTKQIVTLSDAYLTTLFFATGKTNLYQWGIYAPGEALFLGVTGSVTGTEPVDLTFRFECSPDATGLTVGNITGITKGGWDYLWTRHYEIADPVSQTMVKIPLAVYVERVYERTDFALLGLD